MSQHPLLDKLRFSGSRSIQEALREVAVQTQVIQDFRPLSESLEWELSDWYWAAEGVRPFVANEVPFIVNNNGRASKNAAACLFANCLEAEPLEEQIVVFEVGAGSGLFARYFLDALRIICEQEGRDFYERLSYVVSDRSRRAVEQWQEAALFADHEGHVIIAVGNALRPTELSGLQGNRLMIAPPRAVFANYALDVLPAAIIRAGVQGPEQLCVRTHLATHRGLLSHYSHLSPLEVQALANSEAPTERAKLLPVLTLLELETAFQLLDQHALPYLAEALACGASPERFVLNYGAIGCLEELLRRLRRDGFVLINDYGPVTREQVAAHASIQRFGNSIATGINFPFLEEHFARQGIIVTKADGDETRQIHTRLLCQTELPRTREAYAHWFSATVCEHFEAPAEEAKRHAAASRYNEALESYRIAIERSPRDWQLVGQAAEFVALQLKDFEAGLELSKAALELNPAYSAWLWNVLGDCLFCLERFDDAHTAYLQAAQIAPDDARTNFNLSYTWFQQDDYCLALTAIARALAHDTGGAYRDRLLHKQQQIMSAISERALSEQERLLRRAAVFA